MKSIWEGVKIVSHCLVTCCLLVQGLDGDALAQLMQSVSLQSGAASQSAQPSQADTSHDTALEGDSPAQQSPTGAVSGATGPSQGEASVQHDLLADCPLPFEEGPPGAAARTPAKARRPAKRVGIADDTSDTESRVSQVWFLWLV